MKETLTCAACGKSWKRDVVRGRKPKLCAKCVRLMARGELSSADETGPAFKKTATVASSPVEKKSKTSKARVVVATKISEAVNSAQEADNDAEANLGSTSHQLTKAIVYENLFPRPSNWRQLKEETKNGSTWQCPKCKWQLELILSVIDIPSHKCTPISRSQPLERIK